MRVVTVVGNRPQFVKAAAVSRRLREGASELLVHTGQHYDPELSDVFFEELDLPLPDRELEIGSGSHAEQTAAILVALEPLLVDAAPDGVLVYGDTNSTLGAALAAAKLDLPTAHVEAGMRSFDRSMPEEVNRVVADRLSSLLLCSTPTAVENLRAEGIVEGVELVGDVMADVALALAPFAERRSEVLERLGLAAGSYLVATAHRAANVDEPERLGELAALLVRASETAPVVFCVHPRTRARLEAVPDLGLDGADVRLVEPLGYFDFTRLLRNARAVLTDSGGVQKEAYLAGVPCLTLRDETEWVETVETGWNRLVGLDAEAAMAALEQVDTMRGAAGPNRALYGDGRAGSRVAEAVIRWLSSLHSPG